MQQRLGQDYLSYMGPRGPSWLQRWAITRGEEPGEQPEVPDWVRRASEP